MRPLSLRERLSASLGHPQETPETETALNDTTITLSDEDINHVNEVINDLTPQQSADTVTITDEEMNSIQEMFGDMYPESEPEPEPENEEEEEEEEEVVPEPQPRQIIRTHPDINIEATSRFSGAMWYDSIKSKDVTVVGVGGIGSWTALLISRLGISSLTLYDDDTVEIGNISGQFYSSDSFESFKVDALAREIGKYSLFHTTTALPEKFGESSYLTPVTISCLDSMEARRLVFAKWKDDRARSLNKNEWLFIDGRLSAETLQVFTVSTEEDISRYESTLFDDSEADSEICSYKQTSFMANMIASIITNVFVNNVASKLDGGAVREIPFKTEYLGEMMWFKTEM